MHLQRYTCPDALDNLLAAAADSDRDVRISRAEWAQLFNDLASLSSARKSSVGESEADLLDYYSTHRAGLYSAATFACMRDSRMCVAAIFPPTHSGFVAIAPRYRLPPTAT